MSDFYGSVAEANAYHAARGNTAWTASPDDGKEAAMLRATAWLDGQYGSRWPGVRVAVDQVLGWPRYDAFDADGYEISSASVPVQVEHAAYEAALREFVTAGTLSPDYTPAQGVKSETVGPISVTYRDGIGGNGNRPVVTVIDDILVRILGAKASRLTGQAVRA